MLLLPLIVKKHKARAVFLPWRGLFLISQSVLCLIVGRERNLYVLFFPSEFLDVDRFLNLLSSLYRKLGERLPLAKLPYDTSLFELPLEFFEGSFNVFAFFYWYYDHSVFLNLFNLKF